MKKRWDELLEDASGRKVRLQKMALRTGTDKDWASYEGALIRDGEITTALKHLTRRASIENLPSIRRVLDQVKPVIGKELMASGMVDGKLLNRLRWLKQ